MKKILMFLTTLLSLFIVGCSANSTSIKAVEEGKIALVSKEYDKAKDLFKLALNEDSNNSEAESLLDLTINYIDLIAIIENNEFDKVDELISKIENNSELDIIKEQFSEIKNSIVDKKEKFSEYVKQVEAIESLLSENKIDDAKNQATAKLEEVKGIKTLEDRLNVIIIIVDEKINNAKAEILKYYDGIYDISYRNMEFFNNNEVTELNGKAVLNFIEDQDLGSPREYIYRMEDGGVFRLNQGEYYWVSNNNKLIYRPKEIEEAYAKLEELEKEQEEKAQSQIKISPEEAREIALKYFLSKRPEVSEDEVFVGMADYVEDNEYFRPIALDNGEGNAGKVIAEYYVNAATGEVRVLWD